MKQAEALRFLWSDFVRAFSVAAPAVNKALSDVNSLSLSEFTVLQLAAEAATVTMTDLQHGAAMSASGITRIVRSLAAQGLLTTARLSDDRRLRHVGVTAAGTERLAAAHRTVDAVLLRLFGENLERTEIALLAGVLAKLGSYQPA